jgi:hypothetical protein
MQTRERFQQAMRFGPVDRAPLFDEGFRDETLDAWHAQGLPAGESPEDRFHYDARYVLRPDLYPRPGPGIQEDPEAFFRRFDPEDPSRHPKELEAACGHAREECVIGLHAHIGLFQALGVGDWTSFTEALVLLADDPAFVREAMQRYADFVLRITRPILDLLEVDYISFSEPIGATRAPLVSPSMYRELALDSYRGLIGAFARYGIETFVFTTYANARSLLPDVLDAGFNTLWAMESESRDMDYEDIRDNFGSNLRLIGGVDLDTLMQGPDAIRRELNRKVPPLLASGGYIPLADGRVRPQFAFADYTAYRQLLEHLVRHPTST